MITKEAANRAYQIGVQKALVDAGMLKEALIGDLALGAGVGAIGGGLSDESTAGVGALRGAGAMGGANVGGALVDRVLGAAILKNPEMLQKMIQHPGIAGAGSIAATIGALGAGGYGGYKLMKEFGPNPRQTLAQKLHLSQ
jgi:hypothetical protein